MEPSAEFGAFASINRGYDAIFRVGRLSVGLVVPLENYAGGPAPTMKHHIERAKLADALGFGALWLRDVPFNVPSFGDAGQLFDPFVYLGALAMQTERIALGVASVVLPLRHPAHVAKAAASADVLSGGRLLLGVASGDRPEEYPALDIPFAERGRRFRESFAYIRGMAQRSPSFGNAFGRPGAGIEMVPKPTADRLPMLITGGSQQDPPWIAGHGDGWMLYPRNPSLQASTIRAWRARVRDLGRANKPVMQPLYFDLADDPHAAPQPIHLGFRSGIEVLRSHLRTLEAAGVNHVALNLRFCQADVEATLERLALELLPDFQPDAPRP